jgi:IS1 family transposase
VITPPNCTTSWSLFPPKTAEVQFDEKWAFVGKKQKNCDPEDAWRGDCWDHVALDPESRLVVSLVVGKRTAEATHTLVRDFRRRTANRVMRLMTSDEYPVYEEAIRDAPVSRTRRSRRR